MTLASAIAALQAISVTDRPVTMYSAEQLSTVFEAFLEALEALDPGGVIGSGPSDGAPGLDLSLPPYSADRTGVADCSPILEAAIAAGNKVIWFPAGTYRFDTMVSIPFGTALFGAGPFGVTIDCNDDLWCQLQNDPTGVDPFWSRCQIRGFTLDMAQGGIAGRGHGIIIKDIVLKGGSAGSWGIDLGGAGGFLVENVVGGRPGTGLIANGVRVSALAAGDDAATSFQSGRIANIGLRGGASNWIGLELSHLATSGSACLKSLHVSQINCDAYTTGPAAGAVAVGAVYVRENSVGVKLRRVQDSTFENVRCLGLVAGVFAQGDAAAATSGNTFVSCGGQDCKHIWADTNGYDTTNVSPTTLVPTPVASSVKGNTFIASRVAPLQPTSGSLTLKRGTGDAILGGGLIGQRPSTGADIVALRPNDGGDWYMTGLGQESGAVPYDSAPTYATPQKAIGFRPGDSAYGARIFRPQGYADGKPYRLILGNGEGFTVDDNGVAAAVSGLQAVEVADPLYLTPRTIEPLGYGSTVQGEMINASALTVIGSPAQGWWHGPGLYTLIDDATQAERIATPRTFVPYWAPMAMRPGFFWTHSGRSSAAFTMDRRWFGKYNSSSPAAGGETAITVPADLIRAEEDGMSNNKGSYRFWLRRAGDGTVKMVAGTGVTFKIDGILSTKTEFAIPRIGQTIECIYIRTGAATAEVIVLHGHRHYKALTIPCLADATNLTVSTSVGRQRMPYAFRLVEVRAHVVTAPTGAAAKFDIKQGGTTILSTQISIDVSAKTSVGSAAPYVISNNDLNNDAEITVDITQIGSTVAGAGLKVMLIGYERP